MLSAGDGGGANSGAYTRKYLFFKKKLLVIFSAFKGIVSRDWGGLLMVCLNRSEV
jgi:hypothetical protein